MEESCLIEILDTLGIIVAFVVVVALVVRGVNLGVAAVLSSIILATCFRPSIVGILNVLLAALFSEFTDSASIVSIASIALIPILAVAMEETGFSLKFTGNLKHFLPRGMLAIIPSVFGLLPMFGGALFSAPLISNEADELGISPERKSFLNVWFRHVWFLVSPIHPSLILAAGISGIGIYQLALGQMPIFLVYLLFGSIGLLRSIKRSHSPHQEGDRESASLLALVIGLVPIIVAIVLNVLGLSIIIALAIAIMVTLLLGKTSPKKVPRILVRGFQGKLIFSIFGILLFRQVIEKTGAASLLGTLIKMTGIPPVGFLIVMSMMLGLFTGIANLAIALAFPLISTVIGTVTVPVVSMIYLSCVVGYIFSPMHPCFVLSNDYFKARVGKVYRFMIPYLSVVYVIGLVIAYVMMQRTI